MDIVVNEELKAYIDPLTPDEYEALERSLLAEGCRDALVLWGNVLVDGHNRYGICRKHGLPFQTVQNTRFQSMEDVHLWMIDQHLGRRSLSDYQRGVLALRKREIVGARRASTRPAAPAADEGAPEAAAEPSAAPAAAPQEALNTREALARAARLRASQVAAIEKIHKQATPEVVAALKAGDLSLNAAAAVASLPAEEQVAVAAAGVQELKQAAKRVREQRRKPAERPADGEAGASAGTAGAGDADGDGSAALQARIAELTRENKRLEAENAALRKQVLTLLDKRGPLPADAGAGASAGPDGDDDAPF